jgi:hypothetical protein
VKGDILASVSKEETGATVRLKLNVNPPGGILRIAIYNASAHDFDILCVFRTEESLTHRNCVTLPSSEVVLLACYEVN